MMQRRTFSLGCRLSLALMLLVGLATPGAAAVRADVDRTEVYLGDTVTLVVESNAPSVGEPDLSVLQQDFEILGTGTSNRFSVVNGRSSSLRTWRVQLRPRRLGELTIPVLRLGNEQTRSLAILVSDIPALSTTSGDAPALVEVSVDAEGPIYVQQQIPLTLRLYQGQRVVDGTLDPLQVAYAIVEPLGLERRYTVTRNGRQYRVSERRYAVAAERRGLLEIPGLDFRGKLAPVQPGAGGVQPFRVSSEPLTIDVQPPAFDGDYWLPAQQLSVQDSWADRTPTPRRGEPVDRVITLQATGLNGAQLPILEPVPPSGTRIYPGRQAADTRSDSDTLYGISRQTFTYVPGEEGKLRVPSFTVNWWNTTTQQQESAEVAGLSLQVMPGAVGRSRVDPRESGEPSAIGGSGVASDAGMPRWLWLLIAAGALLALYRLRDRLIVGWGAIRQRIPVMRPLEAQPPADTSGPEEGPPGMPSAGRRPTSDDGVRQYRQQLESACQRHDAQAAAQALLALGRVRWPDTPPTNLRDLAQRLQLGQVEIEALDRVLYGGATSTWDGAALWAALGSVEWQRDGAVAKQPEESLVPPLYPHKV